MGWAASVHCGRYAGTLPIGFRTAQELTVFLFCFILESYKHQVGKIEPLYVSLVQQKTLQALQGSAINKITNIPQCTLPPRPDHPF